ncbi:MAG: LPS assembly protein LptD, partial [Phycisphaerae bacterium]
MARQALFGLSAMVSLLATSVHGQGPFPIADQVETPLTPSGISETGAELDGKMVFLFQADDGAEVAHFLGGFQLRQQNLETYSLRAKEAIVWITEEAFEGRAYRHLEILLWRDAEIIEPGGTVTTGPALFVTLNTFSDIQLNADDITHESSADQSVYQKGNAIRKALSQAEVFTGDIDSSLRVLDTSGLSLSEAKPKIKPPLLFQAPGEVTTQTVGDREVVTVVGGAYLSRGDPDINDYLEIRADAVVVYLPKEAEGEASPDGGTPSPRRRGRADRQRMTGPFGDRTIDGIYLEGDVQMQQGPITVRADRLYYDFVHEKALILDAVVHTAIEGRNVTLYVRASEVRQRQANEFTANDAVLTTSEFYTPHYHLAAREVRLINRTPLEPTGKRGTLRAGTFEIKDVSFRASNVPLLWWPYLTGNIDTSESAIRSLRTGFSEDFGVEKELDLHLFNVLGLETPDGFDGTLSIDYFSERGPAVGVDVDYEQERYYGLWRSYLIHDDGEDNLGRRRRETARSDTRGRTLLRHRQYLEDDWQLTFELSYISDESFLEEFFEKEFDNDKKQETLVYLKKQRDNWALTLTAQTRVMDFTTQTERFPEVAFFLEGEPVGSWGTLYSENRVGFLRFRPADQSFFDFLVDGRTDSSGMVGRADTRQEISVPLDLGPVRVVPFASVRGTAYDDSPEEGGLGRLMGTAGVRGSLYLWRVYPEARSELFDINGVRHIVKPDFTAWAAGSNHDAEDLFPFDSTVAGEMVDSIDGVSGVQLGVRQRWQTKRGYAENRRTVDFLTLDVELGLFDDATDRHFTNGYTSFSRPENSIARNYVNSAMVWRVNDRTTLLSELNYDLNDGEVDVFNLSLAVERSPRMSYLIGYRYIEETDSNLAAFDMNYRLSEKHTLAFRELFDLQSGRTLDFTVGLIRKFPRWY